MLRWHWRFNVKSKLHFRHISIPNGVKRSSKHTELGNKKILTHSMGQLKVYKNTLCQKIESYRNSNGEERILMKHNSDLATKLSFQSHERLQQEMNIKERRFLQKQRQQMKFCPIPPTPKSSSCIQIEFQKSAGSECFLRNPTQISELHTNPTAPLSSLFEPKSHFLSTLPKI